MYQEKLIDIENDDIEIDLILLISDFFKIVQAHWKIILLVIFTVVSVYTGYTYITYSPLYKSEATFTVETSNSDNGNYGFYYSTDTADQLSRTFPYILDSNYFRSVLLQKLGEESLNGTLSAETVSDSNMVTMSVESADAKEALKILNAALEVYPEISRFVLGEIQFHIINEPILATSPYNKPTVLKTLGIGLLAGIFIACVIVGLIALFKKSARTLDQMNQITNIKCIAMIPKVTFKARHKKTSQTISISDRRVSFDYKENIRSMQIRLERLLEKNHGKVIMFTSTVASEGKSTISLNLCQSFISSGKRVLLIDGDLRNPSLANMLNVKRSYGLNDVVNANEDILNYIIFNASHNLGFIGNTTVYKNPIPILSSTKLEIILATLKNYFDYIVIDTSPCGIFQDAYELQHLVNAIVYVVKYDFVSLQKIQESLSGLQQDNCIVSYVYNEYTQALNDYGYGKYRYGYTGYYKGSQS